MQSPTYILLKSSCFTVAELKPFQLHIILTRTFSAVKMFCLPRLCLCVRLPGSPPNWTGRPRLRRFLAPWSGPVVRLTRSVCRCDTEGTQQFYFIITWNVLWAQKHRGEVIIRVSDMTWKVQAAMSQTEVWMPPTATACRWAHHNLNHNPTACKTSNSFENVSDFVLPYSFSCSVSLPLCVFPCQPLPSGIFLMFWHVLASDTKSPSRSVWGFHSET